MSKSLNSPTARLLQTSRLFSLPRPLPVPSLEQATSGSVFRASDTATLPYPTHQAIATPASSHFRGDWGLKRPLPGKATRFTSTPVIRVRAQDNPQHITDFESAADHTLTERKWQEMGVPLMAKSTRASYTNADRVAKSVYEDNLDNTDPNAATSFKTGSASRRNAQPTATGEVVRWKYDSPWITGMQEGDFNRYIAKTIASKRDEFRTFLIDRITERRARDEERSLLQMGGPRQLSASRKQALREETEKNFKTEEKRLRDAHTEQHLGSELTAAICEFLDLPGIRVAQSATTPNAAFAAQLTAELGSDSRGPPSTHPAAGLSHLRTNAFMEMHPLWGAQCRHSPVLARVVRPRIQGQGHEHQAKVGVGGVVTNDPQGGQYHPERNTPSQLKTKEEQWLNADRMTHQIDADIEHGNKIWVHPEIAHIDEAGRIRLDITRGDKEAIAVKTSHVEPIIEAKSATRGVPTAAPVNLVNANYGTSLSDQRYTSPRTGVRGFDQELGRTPEQGRKDASAKIQELLASRGDQ